MDQHSSSASELWQRFPGDTEMAGRMRDFDWAASEFGPVESWPANLRVAVRLCLASRFPILLWWGPSLSLLYNDAYLPWLSEAKHPRALGRPGYECWSEVWDVIGPMLESVRSTGEATWSVDVELFFQRMVRKEEVYVTWTFAPILADDGKTVDGIFCPCFETTEKVIGARRLETLRKLSTRAAEARTAEAACKEAAAVMGENARDIPFAAVYVTNETGNEATRCAMVVQEGEHRFPVSISASEDHTPSPWPLASVLRTRHVEELADLDERGVRLPSGPWPEAVRQALVLPIHGAQGQLAGVLVCGVSSRRPFDAAYRTFFDLVAGQVAAAISDARAYEAERQRAEALAELDRAKTAFFSNVSHEFRTPLTLVLGTLEDELRASPVASEQLEMAHRNGLRLLKLVNTLLDFSRIEARGIEVVYEPTDLAAYTSDLAGIFRSATDRAGLDLVLDCPRLPEPVFVDREMWEKIVFNLLSNAFKFTFEGSITLGLHHRGDRVELVVADTGVGIPEAELPHVFERFHRVSNTRSRTHEGTGIGLALVQELVKLHGGEVDVKSADGRGATFTVSIPVGDGHLPKDRVGAVRTKASTATGATPFVEEALGLLPGADAAPTTRGEEPSPVRARILVVDDNADMRQYLRHVLAPSYAVTTAPDGVAALDAARQEPPDLILADVMMPNLDGFGLLRAVRDDARLAGIPVVMLSARAGEEATVDGLRAGADDYLVKPFSGGELLARVDAQIHRKRMEEALRESEERFRSYFELGLIGMAITSPAKGIVAVNDELCKILGYERDELLQMTWAELTHPDDLVSDVTQFDRIMAGEIDGYRLDKRWICKDSRIVDASISVRALRRADGSVDYLMALMQDVTESKRAEERLLRAHDELERRVAERTSQLSTANEELLREVAERKRAELELRLLEEKLAADLAAMTHLNETSTRMLEADGLQPLLEEVVTSTIELQHADFGTIQLYNPQSKALEIVAQCGFRQGFLDYFSHLDDEHAACGRAMHHGERVVIEDVETDPGFEPHRRIAAQAGYRAVQSTPLFSRDGNLLGMLSTFFREPHRPSEHELRLTDLYARQAVLMIERERAKEALRRSEVHLIQGQRVSHTGSCVWNVSSGDLMLSEEHCRIFGLDPEHGKTSHAVLLQRVHPEDRPFVEETIGRAARELSDFELEYRILLPDGSTRYLHALGRHASGESGEVVEYIGTVIDMTERRLAGEELRRSEAYLTQGQRLSHTGSWALNMATGDLFWSREHFRIVGLDHETTRPMYPSSLEVIHPDDRAFVQEALESAILEGSDFEVDCRVVRPDGSVRHIHSLAQPVTTGSGEIAEYVGTIVDTTERTLAEEALQKVRADLAHVARVATLGEMTASIAHELNQPLGAIVTNGEAGLRLLARETPDTAEVREAMSAMVQDALRASDVIKSLRAFSRKAGPDEAWLDVNEAIRGVIALAKSQRVKEQVSLRTELEAELPQVLGDRVQLQQVMLNLILNSVEAMSGEGWEPRDLLIRSEMSSPDEVTVAVRDSGAGLDPKHGDRIFDAFFTSKESGLGLGLSVSRSIVEAHGGRLWATPNEGRGATFRFTLPTSGRRES